MFLFLSHSGIFSQSLIGGHLSGHYFANAFCLFYLDITKSTPSPLLNGKEHCNLLRGWRDTTEPRVCVCVGSATAAENPVIGCCLWGEGE